MNNLIEKWEQYRLDFLGLAEESFFANDFMKAQHFGALARQWKHAIEQLQEEIIQDLLNGRI